MADQPKNPVETIEITNFGGRLTRIVNGDLNSGFAKFVPSWGYDPFSKPGNLTWLEAPVDISSSSAGGSIAGLVLTAKPRNEGIPGTQYVYAVDNTGVLYKIQPNNLATPNVPNLDQPSVIGVIAANSPTFTFGASMDFYAGPTSVLGSGTYEQIYVGSNTQINSIQFDGSGDTHIGSAGYLANTYRPLKQFSGKLFFGNGNTVGAVDATGTVTSSVIGTGLGNLYSELNPPLSVESRIHDLDVSPDGNYLLMTASAIPTERITVASSDAQSSATGDGTLYLFNGSDQTVTSSATIPSYAVTALQTYLNNNMFFANDAFGASLNDGTNKLLTLPNNKSPLPNATLVNGNFISWMAPEITPNGTGMVGSLYYFGSLDQENPPGLFRLLRYGTRLTAGFIYQIPLNLLVTNQYRTLNGAKTAISTLGYGKHYFSVFDLNSSGSDFRFVRFLVTPTGTGTAQGGTYETQTQLFNKKITVKQVRVYTEPTAINNGFELDLIGSDGTTISNGSFIYTFAAGSDPTLLQGSLQRVDFNPGMNSTYALAVNIANAGSANMTIKKVEIDWCYSGK